MPESVGFEQRLAQLESHGNVGCYAERLGLGIGCAGSIERKRRHRRAKDVAGRHVAGYSRAGDSFHEDPRGAGGKPRHLNDATYYPCAVQVSGGGLLLLSVPLRDEQNDLVLGESCLDCGQRRGTSHQERDDYIGKNDNIPQRKDRNPVRRRDALVVALKSLRQGGRGVYASFFLRTGEISSNGCVPFVMHDSVTLTSTTSSLPGRSNITSIKTSSRIARRPRAPVPRLSALPAIATRAASSKVILTSSSPNSCAYCLVSAFFGSLRIRTSDSSSSPSSATVTGRRPTSSGINPYRSRSSGSTSLNILVCASFLSRAAVPLKPICRRPVRASMIFSRPSNAPPQMNRMSLVFSWMYSCCGCFRPP